MGLEVDAECVDAFDLPARLLSGVGMGVGVGGAAGALGAGAANGSATAATGSGSKKRAREADVTAAVTAAASAASAPVPVPAPATQLAFVVGAMSHGNINPSYITTTVSLSRYPLSAACTVAKLTNAFEHYGGIL